MPRFSTDSFSKLSTCEIDLQTLFFEVIKSVDCTISEGHRGQEEQDAAFSSGNSKLKYPNGNHNSIPSNAVDVYFYPVEMDNNKKFYWFGGYVLGIAAQLKAGGKMTHSIRWGGSWDGLGILNEGKMLNDLVHFELLK